MSGILVIVLVFFAIAGGVGIVAYFTYQKKLRRAKAIERGLKMVPVLIHLPPPSADTHGGSRELRDVMREKTAQAEVLYNLLAGTATEGFKSNFYGQRHIALELIVSDGLVHFYAAVPVAMVSVVKKAIQTAYPGARMEEAEDHNIFNQEGRLAATLGGELVLRAESAYPIATYEQLERDPMEALLTTVAALEKADGVAIQIMLRPAGQGWIKRSVAIANGLRKGHNADLKFSAMDLAKAAVKSPTQRLEEERARTGGVQEASPLQLSQVERIEEKTKHPGFEVLIRVIVSTGSTARSQQLLRDISTTFALYEAPGLNGFKFLPALDVQGLVTAFIFRFFPAELNNNILSSAELATLFHLPDAQFTPSTSVTRQLSKQVDGPVQLPTTGLMFGYNEFRGVKKEIRLSSEDRRRHTYILGQTGTGKSTMLENLAVQDMLAGNGFAFIDPHGDSAEKLLSLIPKERSEDVIYFNPADLQFPLGLNLFEFSDPSQKDFLVQETINMLYKLYDPGHTGIIGPRYEHWYRNAALTLMSDPGGATFIEIPKVFTDTEYLKRKFRHLKDPTVIDFWTKEMGQTSDYHKSEMLGWFVSKFGAFQNNEMMRNIIGQTKSAFNMRDVMDKKKILIVNLSKGRIGELNSQLLGMIFVIKFQAAAMSRADMPEDQRTDFALYVDEFQNFSTDSFASILSEARKYRLNLIVANQFIGQLSEQIRDAVFGNIGTIVAHRMGPEDAEFMVKQFAPAFDASDLVNIPNYHAVMRLMIGGLPSQPFTIADSAPIGGANAELGLAIKQLSAAKYGHDKAAVEADLLDRLTGTPGAATPAGPGPGNNQGAAAPIPAAGGAAGVPAPVAPAGPGTPIGAAAGAAVPAPAPVVQPVAPAVGATPAPVGGAPAPADPVVAAALTTPPSTATMAVTPPPIGAPPIGVTPAAPAGAAASAPVAPAAAGPAPVAPAPAGSPAPAGPAIKQPDATNDLASQIAAATNVNPVLQRTEAAGSVAPAAPAGSGALVVTPPPIGAPPIDLPQSGQAPAAGAPAVKPAGTLSVSDITGGKTAPVAEPPAATQPASALDEVPVLAGPAGQVSKEAKPLENDPYSNIDVLGQPAPVGSEPEKSSDDQGDNEPPAGPAPGGGQPLANDPYASIDVLGAPQAQPTPKATPDAAVAAPLEAGGPAAEPVAAQQPMASEEPPVQPAVEQPAVEPVAAQPEPQAAPLPEPAPSTAPVPVPAPSTAPAPVAQPEPQVQAGLGDWSNEPPAREDLMPVEPQVGEENPKPDEPLIHFVDPGAEQVLSAPDETAAIGTNGELSVSGLPEGVHLVSPQEAANASVAPVVAPAPVNPAPAAQVATTPAASVSQQSLSASASASVVPPAQLAAAEEITKGVKQPVPVDDGPQTGAVTPSLDNVVSLADSLPPEMVKQAEAAAEMPTAQVAPASAPAPTEVPETPVEATIEAPQPAVAVAPTAPAAPEPERAPEPAAAAEPAPAAETPAPAEEQAQPEAKPEPAAEVKPVEQVDGGPVKMAVFMPDKKPDETPKPEEASAAAQAAPAEAAGQSPAIAATVKPEVSADQIKQAEKAIDDLMSEPLIREDDIAGHHRLPEPVMPKPSDETGGADLELNSAPPAEAKPVEHEAMHHGMKVLQPITPIETTRERFAKELAEMQAKESMEAAAQPKTQPAGEDEPKLAPQPKFEAKIIKHDKHKRRHGRDEAPKPQVVQPQAAAPANPDKPVGTPAPTLAEEPPASAAAQVPALAQLFDEGLPPAESLAATDVAQVQGESGHAASAVPVQAAQAPAAAPAAQQPQVAAEPSKPASEVPKEIPADKSGDSDKSKHHRRRGGSSHDKPAEIIASKAEAEHNQPSEAAAEAAPLTGKLILPTGNKPAPEPAPQPAAPTEPKKLAPGEVYVDASGNVVIGE